MGYTDDWFEADATGAFPAFGRPGDDEVRYADSGLLPDDVLPAGDAWLPGARQTPDSPRTPGSVRVPGSTRATHGRRVADGNWAGAGTRVAHGCEIAHESPLTDAGRHARDSRLTGSDCLTEYGRHAESGFPESEFSVDPYPEVDTSSGRGFPRGGRDLDGDDGIYPVVDDWYAGYEQFAGELDDRPGQSPAAAEEEPLIRAYARPTDPREVPGLAGEKTTGEPLADYPARSSLTERIVRLRPDRWLIAGGGLAAAAAVVVAFVMAGGSGSATTPGSTGTTQTGTMQTATAHATQPVCVTPAPGAVRRG
jgi:hypothetical protein